MGDTRASVPAVRPRVSACYPPPPTSRDLCRASLQDRVQTPEPERAVVLPADEVATPVRRGIGHVGERLTCAERPHRDQRIAGLLHGQQDIAPVPGQDFILAEDRGKAGEIDAVEGRFGARCECGSETLSALDQVILIEAPHRENLLQSSPVPATLAHLSRERQPAAQEHHPLTGSDSLDRQANAIREREDARAQLAAIEELRMQLEVLGLDVAEDQDVVGPENLLVGAGGQDRKSTRLNSSHLVISYAV